MNGQEKLQNLVKKYVDSLGQRWAAMSALYQEIVDAIEGAEGLQHLEALSKLHYDVHKLAGSAGSMGLDELGRSAAALDVYMSAVQSRGDSYNDVDLKQFQSLFETLENLLLCQSWTNSSVLGQSSAIESAAAGGPVVPANADVVVCSGQWLKKSAGLIEQLDPFGLKVRCVELADLAQPETLASAALVMVDQRQVPDLPWDSGPGIPVLAVGKDDTLASRTELVRAGVHMLVDHEIDAFFVVDTLDRYRHSSDGKPVKVMLVDDDPALVSLLEFQFETAGMDVTSLTDPEDLLQVLASVKPEVLVLDRNMPTWDGFDIAMVVRQVPAYADLPLVFLTADQRADSRLTALALGGDDYLHKPVDGTHLSTLVRARAMRARALQKKIITDGLTGLLNHMALVSEAQHHCALARRLGQPMSVALIDLDHFKSINDTYGHQMGDAVLRGLSRMLRQRLRRSDVIGRLGGEEFAVVMPNTNPQQALGVIDALRQAFSQLEFSTGSQAFQVTFSSGIAGAKSGCEICPKGGSGDDKDSKICDDITVLIHRADEALYDAKHHGRNRISLSQR